MESWLVGRFAPLRPIKWFMKPHNPLAAFYCRVVVVLFLNTVIIFAAITGPQTVREVCFSLSAAIRDEVVSDPAPLTFSLKRCVGQRDSRGGNYREDSEEDTVICIRKTCVLLAFKEVMS